jgi:ADP-ribose pyrophosphatase YjhB (NUDIX family)
LRRLIAPIATARRDGSDQRRSPARPARWGGQPPGESPEDGARREAEEEFAPVPGYTVAEVIVYDAGGWSYSTVVADVAAPVTLEPVTWEHTQTRWATLGEMARLPLHPGLPGYCRKLEPC